MINVLINIIADNAPFRSLSEFVLYAVSRIDSKKLLTRQEYEYKYNIP